MADLSITFAKVISSPNRSYCERKNRTILIRIQLFCYFLRCWEYCSM